MMFINRINRFGGAGRRRQDKKQCQWQVHASYQLLKESLLLKDTIRETTLPPSQVKKKSWSLVTVFPAECGIY